MIKPGKEIFVSSFLAFLAKFHFEGKYEENVLKY